MERNAAKSTADEDYRACCEQRNVVAECRYLCEYGAIDDKKMVSMALNGDKCKVINVPILMQCAGKKQDRQHRYGAQRLLTHEGADHQQHQRADGQDDLRKRRKKGRNFDHGCAPWETAGWTVSCAASALS